VRLKPKVGIDILDMSVSSEGSGKLIKQQREKLPVSRTGGYC